ncbi:LPS-assembly protein LptD [Rhodocyclaceae bacterium SMB388]
MTEVRGLRITGVRSVELVAEGQAELRRDDLTVTADRLTYNELTDEVSAEGDVQFLRDADRMTGERARLIVHEQVGEIEAPTYAFTRQSRAGPDEAAGAVSGFGQADVIYFEGENQYRARHGTWTTCEPESLDWYIRADDLALDYDREVGVARGASVVFMDVPILWLPWMEFPLVAQRQSGFLVPSVGVSNRTGFDMAVPYYWNIAPNYDATITPRFMGRRGMQLGGEFRYLQPTYSGEIRSEWLPDDRETGESRSLASLRHAQRITPRLQASVDYNWVSDDQYFEDLSTRVEVASQVNLLREGRLTYSGPWWTAQARAQSFQTLSGTAPYQRLPQLTLDAYKAGLPGGTSFAFKSEYVEFKHEDDNRAEGGRSHLYPQISLPIQRPAFYVTPKIGGHFTQYDLDRPLEGGRNSIGRALPIVSVDSGLTFERDTAFFGQAYLQTLEPRLFYVYIPYRDQEDIPVFDSARLDFGFAQMFTENRYTGVDRVGDANELTAAVTSRLIDPATGAERLSATVGQQFFFDDQRVTLNELGKRPVENPRVERRTDVLAALSGRVTSATTLDTFWRYNPFEGETQRFNFGVRYQPEVGKALNLSYRYALDFLDSRREGLEDVDVSGQWPLGRRWYGVGRITRSIRDDRVTEAVAGVEYVSTCGCWVFRTAAHRFAIDPDRVTNSLFIQLELTGLGSIGTSPVNLLTRSVPGYGKIGGSMSGRFFDSD